MSHQRKSETISRRSILTGSLPAATLTGLAALQGQLRATESLDMPLRVFLGSAQDAEPDLNDLDQDPSFVNFVTFDLNPLLRQLAAGLEATPPFSGPLPTISLSDSDIALLHQQLASFVQAFLQQTSRQGFGPADIEAAIRVALTRLQTILSAPSVDSELAVIDQLNDFSAAIVGNVYIALDQGGTGAVIFSPAAPISQQGNPPDWVDEQVLLIAGLTVELIALVAAVAGVVLPKVPLGPVVKALLPSLKSPAVRTTLTTLLATLANKAASIADKATEILKFLAILSNVGALGRILNEIFSDFGIFDIVVFVLQIVVVVAAFFVPASTAATVARIVVVLGASLKELVNKVKKLH